LDIPNISEQTAVMALWPLDWLGKWVARESHAVWWFVGIFDWNWANSPSV